MPYVALPALTLGVAVFAASPAFAAGPDRPMGHVFDWSHELTQKRLPGWTEKKAPVIRPTRWYEVVNGLMRRAGENGMWFSGYNALPFDLPVHPKDPVAWRRPSVLAREYRATGLSWDVNLEARAATNALTRRWAVVSNPATTAPTRRLSLVDPGYERAAIAEIRRLVPRYARLPYVHAYTGSDEPIAVLPRGPAAVSPFARRLRERVRATYGWDPPVAGAPTSTSVTEGLRWLAYSRYAGDRFFTMKERQATLIRSLDPDATVIPNDYMFLDGFMPWDYTRLSRFADIVEADPYASLLERAKPGRGRYNHGFGAKFLSDLTGKRVRIIVEAFPYAGHTPNVADLEAWTAQALRAGATDVSFYAQHNPRFRSRPFYTRMLDIARRLRGSNLPAPPVDPSSVVVYATASEGQVQPQVRGELRYRTSGDSLYSTYALLGELGHGAFTFDADTRLVAEPDRLTRARIVWLPRGDTLDRPFAERILSWVRAGGTLVATDPESFRRTPDGSSLDDIRSQLIGAEPGPLLDSAQLLAYPGSLGSDLPQSPLVIPTPTGTTRAFSTVPSESRVLLRANTGAPVAVTRIVGAGRVIAFSTNVMTPAHVTNPGDLVTLIRSLQRPAGGAQDDPAWAYRLPG